MKTFQDKLIARKDQPSPRLLVGKLKGQNYGETFQDKLIARKDQPSPRLLVGKLKGQNYGETFQDKLIAGCVVRAVGPPHRRAFR